MLISHRHRYVFVRPFKVSGMSTESCLQRHAPGQVTHQHGTLAQAKMRLSDEQWQSYLKVTMERNPWDKVVSWFFWEAHKEPHIMVSLGCTRTLIELDSVEAIELFRKWLPWRFGRMRASEDSSPIGGHYYVIEGQMAADEVILYESRLEGLSRILKRLDMDYNAGLDAHINRQSRPAWAREYRAFYDAEGRRLVGEEQAFQIEQFGYTF
jgi:hypothetical protein